MRDEFSLEPGTAWLTTICTSLVAPIKFVYMACTTVSAMAIVKVLESQIIEGSSPSYSNSFLVVSTSPNVLTKLPVVKTFTVKVRGVSVSVPHPAQNNVDKDR